MCSGGAQESAGQVCQFDAAKWQFTCDAAKWQFACNAAKWQFTCGTAK
jgi:hypothetical protein